MRDRRQGEREKVLLRGIADASERGTGVDADETAMPPARINPVIPRKGRSFLADLVWRHAGRIGLAFRAMVTDPHANDLDERLRRSQIKQRQLKRRIEELLGEG